MVANSTGARTNISRTASASLIRFIRKPSVSGLGRVFAPRQSGIRTIGRRIRRPDSPRCPGVGRELIAAPPVWDKELASQATRIEPLQKKLRSKQSAGKAFLSLSSCPLLRSNSSCFEQRRWNEARFRLAGQPASRRQSLSLHSIQGVHEVFHRQMTGEKDVG
jgi:hypothetical protein